MAGRERKFTIVIAGDSTGAENAVKSLSGKMDGFSSKMDGVANKVTGAVAGAFATDKILSFGGDMLDLSSQLAAIDTKVKTVFEGQAGSIRQWADDNNESFGLTDDKLAGLAANFGDLLKPMGFTSDEAAGMSKEVVGLAGALSAWSGGTIDTAGAADKLAAAMLGEREGLKELGISISQADVDSRLAAKGQSELTGAAREQAEAVATQELIFEKSKDAQAAWAEGGNEALKAQNELKATVGELQEQLAGKLVPVILKVFEVGAKLAGWAQDNKPVLMALGIGIAVALVPAFVAWAIAAGTAAIATLTAAAPVIALGIAVAALAYLVITHWDTIKAATLAVKDFVVDKFQMVIDFFVGLPGTIAGIASGMWDSVKDAAVSAKDFVVEKFESVVGFVTGLPGRITGAASRMFWGLVDAMRDALNALIGIWNSLDLGIHLGFEIPSWVPGVGGKGFHFDVDDIIPDVGYLAQGGVTTGPMLAVVGDNASGREAIVPLERASEMGFGGGDTHIHFHGPVSRDSESWIVGVIERAGAGGKKLGPGGRKLVGATP